MRFFPIFRGTLLGFLVVLLVVVATQCQADEQVVEVVGIGECADCNELKIQTNHAFPGLHVTIDCKNQLGNIERWGVGNLNEEGKFKVSLPKEILKDGNLKHECYAQLHSASLAPCPAQNGLKSIKIVAKTDVDGKHITFEPAQKLTFSTQLCTSATFWPPHKPLPKLPKIDFGKHHFGHKYKFPPLYKKPFPPMFPTPPVPKTPEPPVTIPKTPEPPVTIPKTPEPPVTIPKKPEPPSKPKKPEPPSKPKKPCPPEKPKKEEPKKEKPKKKEPKKEKPKKEEPKKHLPPVEKPPIEKPPPIITPPIEKPPTITPPIITPPIEKPPIKKLPCPPLIPKFPPKDYHHPKLPPFPTIPPKYFHHPKLPPLPPKYSHYPPKFPLPPHIPHA